MFIFFKVVWRIIDFVFKCYLLFQIMPNRKESTLKAKALVVPKPSAG